MKKKHLIISITICFLIISFFNTKLVVLNYRNQPEDFGIARARGYGAMCVYVLFPIICEGSQKKSPDYYLVSKEIYPYWLYLKMGSPIVHEKQYSKTIFYCYNENKKRKVIEKDNHGIACSEEYKDRFLGYEL